MKLTHEQSGEPRLSRDAGIAIGPILFIIAVLGILAAAIAAGSGSFTAGSQTEGNRAKAAALIEIGQNLKIGWDRVTGNGADFANVVIAAANTINSVDLFSPTGGGITIPSTTMSNSGSDAWAYFKAIVPGMGTTNTDQMAVIKVAQGICDEINNKANGLSTPAVNDFGNFAATSPTISNWPSTYNGVPTGCLNNNNSGSTGYYFYQVIGIR